MARRSWLFAQSRRTEAKAVEGDLLSREEVGAILERVAKDVQLPVVRKTALRLMEELVRISETTATTCCSRILSEHCVLQALPRFLAQVGGSPL